jgi:hypothetical protein
MCIDSGTMSLFNQFICMYTLHFVKLIYYRDPNTICLHRHNSQDLFALASGS